MTLDSLLGAHKNALEAFTSMSRAAGRRPDLVQGGGGNTSVKLDNSLMAIKASGVRLDDITPASAYALLDYARLRSFYRSHSASEWDNVEQAGSAATKDSAVTAEGLAAMRPSVEAGFHALLDRYVLHTHPVYANLACCCEGGLGVISSALCGADYTWIFLPYINPGSGLTFAMREALDRAVSETGCNPSVVFLQNHGLVTTHESPDGCAALHEDVCQRLAEAFHVDMSDYPVPRLEPVGECFVSRTPFLAQEMKDTTRDLSFFTEMSLYPDQMVYLKGELALCDGSFDGQKTQAACTVFTGSGDVVYACSLPKAIAMEETLTAILYIHRVLVRNKRVAVPMSGQSKQFIASWESEAYRKAQNAN